MEQTYEQARAFLQRNPSYKALSARKLHQTLRQHLGAQPPLTLERTKQLLREAAPEWEAERELHRVKRRPKHFYRITAPPYSFQIDVVSYNKYDPKKPRHELLVIVDILSRKAWAYPLKSHNMSEIIARFEEFEKDLQGLKAEPVFVMGDNEFAAKAFREHADKRGFTVRTIVAKDDHEGAGDALGILNRFVQTLRRAIAVERSQHQWGPNWKRYLSAALDTYNNSAHGAHSSAGGKTPNQVFADFDELLTARLDDLHFNWRLKSQLLAGEHKVRVGDWVRVLLPRKRFEKGRRRLSVAKYRVVGTFGVGRFRVELEDGEHKVYKESQLAKTTAPEDADADADAEPPIAARAEEDAQLQRGAANHRRFKRATRLDQEPADAAAASSAAPRQTRLRTGAITRREWARKDVG